MPYNNQQLVKAAETAFGERWRRPLARAMGEHHTQVVRWSTGANEVPDDKLEKAREACRQKAADIMKASKG